VNDHEVKTRGWPNRARPYMGEDNSIISSSTRTNEATHALTGGDVYVTSSDSGVFVQPKKKTQKKTTRTRLHRPGNTVNTVSEWES